MQVLKRELLMCLAISTLVFTSALAWGAPFTSFHAAAQATSPNAAQQTPNYAQQPGQMQQQQASTTFTGTVQKSGSSFVLRTTSGKTYKLSGGNASSYVGKTVTVSGQLDPQSKTIQVSNIQPA